MKEIPRTPTCADISPSGKHIVSNVHQSKVRLRHAGLKLGVGCRLQRESNQYMFYGFK